MFRYILFCAVVNTSSVEIETEIISMHDTISECHVASTVYGFDNEKDQCFCLEMVLR